MRIALIPLDSRPPNWQFPQRLAEIAGVELLLPPRGELGTLRSGADGLWLAQWLQRTCSGADGGGGCDAAIFSWDALIYGGLVQSRDFALAPTPVAELAPLLRTIDWQRCQGYAYLTIPRLGITVDSNHSYATHLAVREYFILSGQPLDDPGVRARLEQLEHEIGRAAITRLDRWRERNHSLALAALDESQRLGLHWLHAAVEDNAPTGPHVNEVKGLLKRARKLAAAAVQPLQFSSFDGADECACLQLARAVSELRRAPALPLQLTVHPSVPGPDRYTGLYETHSLGDGLTFLGEVLALKYCYDSGALRWLVTHGVQPQPDAFESEPTKIFANPYLLPKQLQGDGPLLATDLAACNGTNPALAPRLAELANGALIGLAGFNTNFNALGLSAAWLRVINAGTDQASMRRFALERLADDLYYQSLARPGILRDLRQMQLDVMDFSRANMYELAQLRGKLQSGWQAWCEGPGAPVLLAMGIPLRQATSLHFDFPWLRAFECEVQAPQ